MKNERELKHTLWMQMHFYRNEMCRTLEIADSLQGGEEEAYRIAVTNFSAAAYTYAAITGLISALGYAYLLNGGDPLDEEE